jgi:Methyltransferase domain/C-methyltransferase C-terminal domain
MPWFDFGDVPVRVNGVTNSAAEARNCGKGRLDLHLCNPCGFLWNAGFDENITIYDEQYENFQGHSGSFQSHLSEVRNIVLSHCLDSNAHLVEAGCGQGDFLRSVLAENPLLSAEGYDDALRNIIETDRLKLYRGRFQAATKPVHMYLSRHVIEHVPRPIEFLESLRGRTDVPDAQVLVETPDLGWIDANQTWWDLCYEHCSYFTTSALTKAFAQAGLSVHFQEQLFSGQYQVAIGSKKPSADTPSFRSSIRSETAHSISSSILSAALEAQSLQASHTLYLWGAGAKGVGYANAIDPSASIFAGVVDINPAKQGKYLPGTGHQVLHPSKIDPNKGVAIFCMNPAYENEILQEASLYSSNVLVRTL